MGKGLRIGGILLGGMALVWSILLFGIYTLLATAGVGGTFLIAPLTGFGGGALSIAGGILGVRRAELGASLVLAAGIAGLLAAAAPLLFNPQVEAIGFLIAYLAVGWWGILMVLVGGVALFMARRAEESVRDAAPGP